MDDKSKQRLAVSHTIDLFDWLINIEHDKLISWEDFVDWVERCFSVFMRVQGKAGLRYVLRIVDPTGSKFPAIWKEIRLLEDYQL